jgi:hypothetical protein
MVARWAGKKGMKQPGGATVLFVRFTVALFFFIDKIVLLFIVKAYLLEGHFMKQKQK